MFPIPIFVFGGLCVGTRMWVKKRKTIMKAYEALVVLLFHIGKDYESSVLFGSFVGKKLKRGERK